MSDFGTTIIAKRNDGNSITDAELNQLSNSLENIISSDENLIDFTGDPYNDEFHFSSNDNSEIWAVLSEYYYGGDEDEDQENYDTIVDEEMDDAKSIAAILEKQFPDYTFTAEVTEW